METHGSSFGTIWLNLWSPVERSIFTQELCLWIAAKIHKLIYIHEELLMFTSTVKTSGLNMEFGPCLRAKSVA